MPTLSASTLRTFFWLMVVSATFHVGVAKAFCETVVGVVRDSAGKPIAKATVRVSASRPIDASPTVVTILHPDCDLHTDSDEQGMFEIKGISDGHEVMLVAWKSSYFVSRTTYVSKSTENASIVLRSTAEMKLPSAIQGKISDSNDLPIPHAVVGYDGTATNPKPTAVMTDDEGRFVLPSEDKTFPVSLTAVIPHIGIRELRLHSPRQITANSSWTIKPSVTVTGRIIDERGAVPNYNVCVSSATSFGPRILLTAATNAEGRFVIQGVPEGPDGLGRSLAYCLFGDITQANNRGHLTTKQFDAGDNGEELDFGDLRLDPVKNLKLKLQLNGAKLTDKRASVVISLRQQCKAITMPIDENGQATLENLACEPLSFRINASPFRYSKDNMLQPDFTSTGFYFNPKSREELVVLMEIGR